VCRGTPVCRRDSSGVPRNFSENPKKGSFSENFKFSIQKFNKTLSKPLKT
jgi:hypothetical protein